MKSAVRFIVAKEFLVVAFALAVALAAAGQTAAPSAVTNGDTASPTHGLASWYGEEFAGRTTANGEVFEPVLYTAAHRSYPFGTILEVKNSKTGQTVRVRVNDRGPYVADRLIDLSYAAAKDIGLVDSGSGEVDVTVVALGRGDDEPPAPYTVTLAQTKSSRVVPPSVRDVQPVAPAQQQSVPPQQPAGETAQPAAAATQAPVAQAATAPAVQTAPAAPAAPAPQPAPARAATEAPTVDFPLP